MELSVWSRRLAVFLILGENLCLLKKNLSTFMPSTIQYNLVSDILCFQCPSSELDRWDGRDTGRHNWGCIYCVSVLSFLCFLVATWGSFDGNFIDLNMLFSFAAISSRLPSHQNTVLVSACLKSLLYVKDKLYQVLYWNLYQNVNNESSNLGACFPPFLL